MKTQCNSIEKRISYMDFLKVIGLSGIIIAHIGAPNWLNVIRSFDVPLMVILSSILGSVSFNKYENNRDKEFKYFINRVKRLVFPTWIFLLLYFFIIYVFSGKLYSPKYYLGSFCLTRYGIGYVWIILIYLYSAILIPFYKKIKIYKFSFVFLIIVYIVYEIAYYCRIGVDNKLIDTTFYYIIPYGLLTYLGSNFQSFNKKIRNIIICVSFIAFVGAGMFYWIYYGTPQLVQIAKYPPRVYYLGYGILISFLLISICEKYNISIYENKLVCYISQHSMWIYLWHILILTSYEILGFPELWYFKLLIVYVTSILMVVIVNRFLDIIEHKKAYRWFKYLRY